MHRFIANDQADQIRSVGQLSPAGEVHRQPEAGVEEKGFEEHAGDFFLQRLVGLIVTQHQLRLALQGIAASLQAKAASTSLLWHSVEKMEL